MGARWLAIALCLGATTVAAKNDSAQIAEGKSLMRHWYEAIQRCYDSVSLTRPFDAQGYTHVGDEVVDYQVAETRQRWASDKPHVGVTYRIRGGSSTPDGLSPSCEVQTLAQFQFLENAEAPDEVFYWRWWRANGFDDQTQPEAWPFESNKHITTLARTLHGTAAGCPMYMKFQYRAWEQKPEAFFTIWETSKGGCDLLPRSVEADFGRGPMPQIEEFFDMATGG